jgi:glyoxylase-like metal-dependent hydrolase (beta-lactamase superfamily II)
MKGALVDPGGDLDVILGEVEAQGVTLEKVLLTHGHIDHAGAVAAVKDRLGLPVEGPQREDLFLIEGLEEQARTYGFEGVRTFMPDRWLEEGDRVTAAGVEFEVLHCPGHTPGHVVFLSRAHRFALVGDVLFRGSIGRTDFPRGDHAALIRSINEKLLPLGDDITFVPGHGPHSTFGAERQTNPFLRG